MPQNELFAAAAELEEPIEIVLIIPVIYEDDRAKRVAPAEADAWAVTAVLAKSGEAVQLYDYTTADNAIVHLHHFITVTGVEGGLNLE